MARNGKPRPAPRSKAKTNGHAKAAHWVGRKLKRKEDPRLIQGITHYTDDIKLPRMLYCALVRSPYAHAKIRGIRIDAARAVSGVVGVFTAEDTASLGMVPCAIQMPDLKVPKHPVLATDRVRYFGEPVAAVLVDDLYAARQSAELAGGDIRPMSICADI